MGGNNLAYLRGVSAKAAIFFVILLTCTLVSIHWIDVSIITGAFRTTFLASLRSDTSEETSPEGINCSSTCAANLFNQVTTTPSISSAEACPEYFRWIHEDLRPWKDTGITKEMVEGAEKAAYIRIIVVKGKVYVKKLKWVYQTRDVFTLWGILQLLRLYPGEIPDLDIMFECGDRPVIQKSDYGGSKAANIPPMFHYCGSDSTFDIVFPDWSFWGWPELAIKPWERFGKELQQGNKRVKWKERNPNAYWKGNTRMGPLRKQLLKCNDSSALIFHLNWRSESKKGFNNTDLASQCTHRYKIYAEGRAWSVSEKYILACDSVSLLITPHYYDFFTRSLVPTVHYWPVNEKDMCRSIKFAVDWGNKHSKQAEKIGKAGSKFIEEELKMKHVYDYMYHLLNSYGKLLKYQPTIPEGAEEVSLETGSGSRLTKLFKISSMVKAPADSSPCIIPQPYDFAGLQTFLDTKSNLTKQVEKWEARKKVRASPMNLVH